MQRGTNMDERIKELLKYFEEYMLDTRDASTGLLGAAKAMYPMMVVSLGKETGDGLGVQLKRQLLKVWPPYRESILFLTAEGEAEDLDLDPVRVFHRIDGISMKNRELSCCCPLHQCFGHLAVIGMEPLLRAKLLPYQYASIPGKGQVALKRQVERWLRRKSLGIQYAIKLDVKGAYAHTQ